MYLTKTPRFVQNLFPNFTWKIPTESKVIYLTFDDGPIPEITPWVLDLLKVHNAKATFFCVGENVENNPEILERIKTEEHQFGNHTYSHMNGWASDNMEYFHNIRKCARLVDSTLFRPPYGRLKPKQIQFLQRHYNIVMWDVLSGDFDSNLDSDQCFQNVVSKTKSGSILVFHDSLKAEKNLKAVLPKVLSHFLMQGYRFEALNLDTITSKKYNRMSA